MEPRLAYDLIDVALAVLIAPVAIWLLGATPSRPPLARSSPLSAAFCRPIDAVRFPA